MVWFRVSGLRVYGLGDNIRSSQAAEKAINHLI